MSAAATFAAQVMIAARAESNTPASTVHNR